MQYRVVVGLCLLLAGCGGAQQTAQKNAAPASSAPVSVIKGPQIPPVEFGRRKPGTHITSENMPFFDTVTYCERKTRGTDKIVKGPHYEACIQDQQHTQIIIAQAIDQRKFDDKTIEACAEASRTAYQGMWYCLNGQEF